MDDPAVRYPRLAQESEPKKVPPYRDGSEVVAGHQVDRGLDRIDADRPELSEPAEQLVEDVSKLRISAPEVFVDPPDLAGVPLARLRKPASAIRASPGRGGAGFFRRRLAAHGT